MIYTGVENPVLQCTIRKPVHYIGIGLHTGQRVSLSLFPAAPGNGIQFRRKDLPPQFGSIKANWLNVVDTRRCTVLGNEHGATVSTVEHLLAAIRTCGIDNLSIELNGEEVPILDGSSAPMLSLLRNAGVIQQGLPRPALRILRPVEISQGECHATLLPSPVPRISVNIDFEHPQIGHQSRSIALAEDLLESEIAPARTFGFADELEKLHAQGLALGGSMDNAVLLDDQGVVNEEGLRFADEFVRHKILDCIGDLALAGAPIFGHLLANRPGHRINNALLRELYSRRDAWELTSYAEIHHAGERDRGFLPKLLTAFAGRRN
jgi:UDP-3-O-[3-hydroxymyristoyl] N-acetylglucosamine deacetylase